MIEVLIEKKFVSQVRDARHSNNARRKRVRVLRNEILCAMVFSHWESRNARSGSREWIKSRFLAEHVAEIQCVGLRQVMVDAHSKLIRIVMQGLRGKESVRRRITAGRRWKQAQQTLRQRIDEGELVIRDWGARKDVKELMRWIVADAAAIKSFR